MVDVQKISKMCRMSVKDANAFDGEQYDGSCLTALFSEQLAVQRCPSALTALAAEPNRAGQNPPADATRTQPHQDRVVLENTALQHSLANTDSSAARGA